MENNNILNDTARNTIVRQVIAFQDMYKLDREQCIKAVMNQDAWMFGQEYDDIYYEIESATFDAIGD